MKHSFIVVFLECIAVVIAKSKISSTDQCFVCDAVKNIALTSQKNQESEVSILNKF
ncbi:hypothetical protein T4D_13539 [Trichinella pseudospiralis]|uniref:Uncharacterized protein n=1 Tax=Trichinella pseudospiralis TaxID=6337 RepID=A0A0V1FLV4_TRIPS|nr:hypothetical protein T4D_13539 [Trichinella pseudospiralis]